MSTSHLLRVVAFACFFQVIVQRALAAKSLSHAQGGTLMAGVIKILPLFVMVMPGMIARVLFTGQAWGYLRIYASE